MARLEAVVKDGPMTEEKFADLMKMMRDDFNQVILKYGDPNAKLTPEAKSKIAESCHDAIERTKEYPKAQDAVRSMCQQWLN